MRRGTCGCSLVRRWRGEEWIINDHRRQDLRTHTPREEVQQLHMVHAHSTMYGRVPQVRERPSVQGRVYSVYSADRRRSPLKRAVGKIDQPACAESLCRRCV